jgi:hypothetical protein
MKTPEKLVYLGLDRARHGRGRPRLVSNSFKWYLLTQAHHNNRNYHELLTSDEDVKGVGVSGVCRGGHGVKRPGLDGVLVQDVEVSSVPVTAEWHAS